MSGVDLAAFIAVGFGLGLGYIIKKKIEEKSSEEKELV